MFRQHWPEQNIEAAPGSFGEQGKQTFQYTLRYKGRLQSQEEFENIVIRANSDGQVLRLKDIATIELGRLTYGFSNNVNGHPAVTVIVFQTAVRMRLPSSMTSSTCLKNQNRLSRRELK